MQDFAHHAARLRLRKVDDRMLALGVEEVTSSQIVNRVRPLKSQHQQANREGNPQTGET